MYSHQPSFVLGFHGSDQTTAENVFSENKKAAKDDHDFLLRHLDCAVIETVHASLEEQDEKPFDTVRGVFWEGDDLYPEAGFKEKNHVQICVRNPNCIKGFFRVRQSDRAHTIP